MIFRILISILIFGFIQVDTFAVNIDSLQLLAKEFHENRDSKNEMEAYIDLGRALAKKRKFKASIKAYESALEIAKQKGYNERACYILYIKGKTYRRDHQYEKSIEILTSLIKLHGEDDIEFLSKVYKELGKAYRYIGNNELAYEYQLKCLDIKKVLKDSLEIGRTYYEIASIFFYQENWELSLEYFHKTLELGKKLKSKNLKSLSLGAIGGTLSRQKKYEESLVYNRQALELANASKKPYDQAYALLNIGVNYKDLKLYDKALFTLKECKELQENLNDEWGMSGTFRILSLTYMNLHQKDSSIWYAMQSLKIAEKHGLKARKLEIFRSLANIYETFEQSEDAVIYLEKYISLKDSLVSEQTVQKMSDALTRYELSLKEKDIRKKDEQLQNLYGFSLIFGVLAALGLLWLLYGRYKSEIQHNLKLAEANRQLKQKNSEMEEAYRQLQWKNDELARFAHIAAHDLKEPLRNIGSFSSLLNRRFKNVLNSEGQEYLSFITNGVKTMYGLLNDVLNYSELGNEDFASINTDTQNLVESILEEYEDTIKEKNAVIAYKNLPPVAVPKIHAQQLFQNILENALKYSNPIKSYIQISHQSEKGFHVFSIMDNGIGFDMNFKDKIFNIFQRLHGKTEYEGTGIGLAICKKIVTQYGGKIWAESIPGKGSTFHFSLPMVKVEKKQTEVVFSDS